MENILFYENEKHAFVRIFLKRAHWALRSLKTLSRNRGYSYLQESA